MTTWQMQSTSDLAEIAGVIHDSWFDMDHVVHDAAAQTLIIPFAQEWDERLLREEAGDHAPKAQEVTTTWRYREQRVPFMRGSLRVAAVESVDLDAGAGDAAMLLDLQYDEPSRVVTVKGVSGDLKARVQRLHVTAELVDDVALYVQRRHGFLSESDVPLWETWSW